MANEVCLVDSDLELVADHSPARIHSPPANSHVYVELPTLTSSERARYVDVMDLVIPPESEPQEVIGEYTEGANKWYYAKHLDGYAYRYDSTSLKKDYGNILAAYETKKAKGLLAAFDARSDYVHPECRMGDEVRRSRHTSDLYTTGTSRSRPISVRSSEEFEEEWTHDVPEDASPIVRKSRRRMRLRNDSFRKSRPAQSTLPFSPERIRATSLYDEDSSSDSDSIKYIGPLRRSTRTRTSQGRALPSLQQIILRGDDSTDEGSDYDASGSQGRRAPKKAARGPKPVPPEYGQVCSIVCLDLDPLNDEATMALRAHRAKCEKCDRLPSHILQTSRRRKRARSRQEDDDFIDDGSNLGGWVRCLKCPLVAHWACLAASQRDEILKAIRSRDHKEWLALLNKNPEGGRPQQSEGPPRRTTLNDDEYTEFICAMCTKGGFCISCKEMAVQSRLSTVMPMTHSTVDSDRADSDNAAVGGVLKDGMVRPNSSELLFRCITCKRIAHYEHLPVPKECETDGLDGEVRKAALASFYQAVYNWNCNDCASYTYKVDKVLAWRPYPPNAEQPSIPNGQPPSIKLMLPREYLVKWQGRSYRRTTWVHHGWLSATHSALLRSFLSTGSRVELLKDAVSLDKLANDVAEGGVGAVDDDSRDSSAAPDQSHTPSPLSSSPDADRRIPPAWRTVDRVLDVRLLRPIGVHKKPAVRKRRKRVESSDSDSDLLDDLSPEVQVDVANAFERGEQPPDHILESVEEFEKRSKSSLSAIHIDKVIWAFVKWDDLGYEEASWDSPPRRGEPGYTAFEVAFERFLTSREVLVKKVTLSQSQNKRPDGEYRRKYSLASKGEGAQPDLGQSTDLKLMPFQVDGFDWLCDNWWNEQPCILADEMGLGKTVQICTFVGNIIKLKHAFPILVVVPNSTITNWVREFNRWAPRLRVVPFFGESRARDVIKRYELSHFHVAKGTTGAKYHVLVTTYNTITNTKDFGAVFKSQPRWEALIIDEGQRLNNDSSLLFKKLNELNVLHRIIMTGTPLNNNIRELFNLMNFLDADKWNDLKQLEKDYEELTEDRIKELHGRLRPYFLRRIKSEVLQLPPKNEVIVPVSLTPFQKEMYKSILSKNVKILMSIAQLSEPASNRSRLNNAAASKANLNNMLMQLRKCIQHPYLLSRDIEPKGLEVAEAHARLVEASSKLRLLQALLPKLKARGHRVLIFSQFVIALDIIEDFLAGEKFRFLRLDGNTKQADRQKDMDEFNKPGSDIFVYLLTTRAGGVGINLWSADTVIIFDPDFNPHQDLQAISRAHRYGQTKPCLVFKLMAKDTAEERIIQTGKKKLVLDHLIVQNINDEEAGADIQSILTYGAKTLFEDDQQAREIVYTDSDLDNLIERTESQLPTNENEDSANRAFSFAKIWTADKASFEEIPDDVVEQSNNEDSWTSVLKRIEDERKKQMEAEVSGRGVRRKATGAPLIPQQNIQLDDVPEASIKGKRGKKKRKRTESDSDEWAGGSASPSSSESDDVPVADEALVSHAFGEDDGICGLCGESHTGSCSMLESSENLIEYRRLLFQSTDEPYDQRRAAIELIDATLAKRNHVHLIQGEPLFLLPPRLRAEPPHSTVPFASSSNFIHPKQIPQLS